MRLILAALLISTTVLAGEAPPKFTKKPTASKAGAGVKIEFAVDKETDVAVFILDAKGEIVRHLAAGVLGKNSPAPLKPGLSQSVEWDGRADYGKPAEGGPFKVRVALGLGAKYDKILAEDRMNLGSVKALAVGPDGVLYVCHASGASVFNWSGEGITAISREGEYMRTVLPWPSSLDDKDVAGYGTVEIDGQAVPLVKRIARRRFTSALVARKGGMTVTPDGVILRPVGGYRNGPWGISAIRTDGAAGYGKEQGPPLLKLRRPGFGRAFITSSSDGKHAFVSGLQETAKKEYHAAVYRVVLPERGPAEPFFGDPAAPGKGETHLGGMPRGLAVDGKGHLFVADYANNRVLVIGEKDGKYLGELAVERPDCLGVDPASGAIYVTSMAAKSSSVELRKYSGWKDPKLLAKLPVKGEGNPGYPWVMTVDAGARPPIVWMGSEAGSLLRIEDAGASFTSKKINSNKFGDLAFMGIEVDRLRKEVYARGNFRGTWYRFSEEQDKLEEIPARFPSGASGTCLVPAPDGNIYAPGYSCNLYKFSRNGAPVPWPEGNVGYPEEHPGKGGKMSKIKPGPKHGIFIPVSMTAMTHTLGIRWSDGAIFMFEPYRPGDRPTKMLRQYTTGGKRVKETPIIWEVSDTAIGPKFDAAGNIYVAEQVKPVGRPYPVAFEKAIGKLALAANDARSAEVRGVKKQVATMYGSIVKFSPKGGTFHWGGKPYQLVAKEPALAGMKTVLATSFRKARLYPLKVTGAEWIRMGISHVDLFYCNCENVRFDVDEFGRVFYPDLGRFRVGVLDTGGNEITHFGSYGNTDNRGPESREESLKQPDIALAWPTGVGVTDKYVYMGDGMNRRLLRAKITYAAEETVAVK